MDIYIVGIFMFGERFDNTSSLIYISTQGGTMLYILILSLIAPLKPVSWSELKTLTIEPAAPDTVEVVEEPVEVEDAEDK